LRRAEFKSTDGGAHLPSRAVTPIIIRTLSIERFEYFYVVNDKAFIVRRISAAAIRRWLRNADGTIFSTASLALQQIRFCNRQCQDHIPGLPLSRRRQLDHAAAADEAGWTRPIERRSLLYRLRDTVSMFCVRPIEENSFVIFRDLQATGVEFAVAVAPSNDRCFILAIRRFTFQRIADRTGKRIAVSLLTQSDSFNGCCAD